MQVFKAFMKIALKKLPTAMIYISIFMAISIAMAKNSSNEKQFTDSRIDVCVVDEDNSEASKALTDFIKKKHDIVEIENDKDTILDVIYYGTVDYVLTIKDGYQDKILNGETDNLFTNYTKPGTYSDTFFNSNISEYTGTLSAFITAGNDLSSALSKTSDVLSKEIKVKIETFETKSSGSFSPVFGYYFQYLAYIFLAVLTSIIAPVFLTLNKPEIRNRTNCSSIKSSAQYLQIALGSVIIILSVWIIFMVAAVIFNNGNIGGKTGLAILNSFAFLLVSAGIALFISSLISNKKLVDMIATTVSLGMSFLCGVFVPLELLGDSVISVSRFLPAYWYVRANNMLAGLSDEVYNSEKFFSFIGIEFIFAVMFFALFMLMSKVKRNSK